MIVHSSTNYCTQFTHIGFILTFLEEIDDFTERINDH
jgi:hypothetical protein